MAWAVGPAAAGAVPAECLVVSRVIHQALREVCLRVERKVARAAVRECPRAVLVECLAVQECLQKVREGCLALQEARRELPGAVEEAGAAACLGLPPRPTTKFLQMLKNMS